MLFFENLFNDLNNIIKNTHINFKLVNIKELNEKPERYLNHNEFTSENVEKYIKNNLKYSYEINYENNCIIYFRKNKIINKNLPKIIKTILFIIIIIKKLFNRKQSQKVYFFETTLKKKFPKKNTVLNPDNINTALTYLEEEHLNGDIILYRKEEVIKVLIHELIHSNCIDHKIIYSKNSRLFSKMFCSNYSVLLNESFTETMACIINLYIIFILECIYGKDNIHDKIIYNKKELDKMFYNECMYSDYMCSKIKTFYKIDKISNIIKNSKDCIEIFPQETNVISYYFLKNILLHNIKRFDKLMIKYSKDYKITDSKFILELIKLIIDDMKGIDNRFKNVNDKNNSLKMSYYEIRV
jgi:hypothetical protein